VSSADELHALRVALGECRERLERERRFGHSVTDLTPSLLLVVDPDGTIVPGGVNVAMERLSGRSEDELVGSRFEGAGPAAWTGTDEPPAFELPYVTRTGETRAVEWTARVLEWPEGTRYLLCGTDVTDWRRQEERLRESLARLVETADGERRRLERNLHDGAQQRLVTLQLELRLIEATLGADDPVAARLGAARADLTEALEELRELARGLHPAVLSSYGLAVALEGVAGRATIPVELSVEMIGDRPPALVEAAAYYVVSEAVTNAQKHSGATVVCVAVGRSEGCLCLDVSDDGVGGADLEGSGLVGLCDRVEALGGSLELTSPPGRGTRLTSRIPL
jgi:signal transduction histidine kinase